MSTTTAHGPGGRGIPPEGVGGFSQCWFPVALSAEVEPGQLVGKDFLDGRVVVYRGEDGRARVHSAYCRHLGADLSVGDVEGNDVRCPFHHWQYGPDGGCTRIPAGVSRIPPLAKLFAYPVAESLGLIWAFNGTEPQYDVPAFPTYPSERLQVRTYETRRWHVDPFVLLSNSMDFQHLRELHGMKMDFDPADIVMDGYEYEFQVDGELPNFGMLHQHIKCYGNNAITLTMTASDNVEILGAFAGTPVKGGCRGFNIAATPKSAGGEDEDMRVEQVMFMSDAMMTQLQNEDAPVMDTIRFREDILIDADRALARFFRYNRDFPRAHPGDGLVN
jgi:nitrite reductase/ring-hydroxylating ferredoxin subunit